MTFLVIENRTAVNPNFLLDVQVFAIEKDRFYAESRDLFVSRPMTAGVGKLLFLCMNQK